MTKNAVIENTLIQFALTPSSRREDPTDRNLVVFNPDNMIDLIASQNTAKTLQLRRAYRGYVEEMLMGKPPATPQEAKICALAFLLQDACGIEDGHLCYFGVPSEAAERESLQP